LIEALYKGILLGLVLMISVGPIFFAVIETSISKGFRYAFSIMIGTLCSDTLYLLFAYLGLSAFFEDDSFRLWMGICGGILLICFGLLNILKKADMHASDLHLQKKSPYYKYVLKGFLINTLNPFVIFFWVSTLGWASMHFQSQKHSKIFFFVGVLGTVFLTDMAKAFLAAKIKHIINKQILLWVNRIAGMAMIIFGLDLIAKVFWGKGVF
jgi:threonine/homoserine/homoserine lactone efflux protein